MHNQNVLNTGGHSATGLDPAIQNGLPSHIGESRHMKNLKIASLLIAALGACILAGCTPAADKPAEGAAAGAPAEGGAATEKTEEAH
mgnify:CR=1 FL=1